MVNPGRIRVSRSSGFFLAFRVGLLIGRARLVATGQTFRVLALLSLCTLSGCLHQGTPLIIDRSPQAQPVQGRAPVTRPKAVRPPSTPLPIKEVRVSHYVVRHGDTLYSIAWQFKLDHQGLAYANRIAAPYTIYPGQSVALRVEMPPTRPITRRPAAAAKKARRETARSTPARQS